jgi:hypothetical protein
MLRGKQDAVARTTSQDLGDGLLEVLLLNHVIAIIDDDKGAPILSPCAGK